MYVLGVHRQPVIILLKITQQTNKATSTYSPIQNSVISYITRYTKYALRGRKILVSEITAKFSS